MTRLDRDSTVSGTNRATVTYGSVISTAKESPPLTQQNNELSLFL